MIHSILQYYFEDMTQQSTNINTHRRWCGGGRSGNIKVVERLCIDTNFNE